MELTELSFDTIIMHRLSLSNLLSDGSIIANSLLFIGPGIVIREQHEQQKADTNVTKRSFDPGQILAILEGKFPGGVTQKILLVVYSVCNGASEDLRLT